MKTNFVSIVALLMTVVLIVSTVIFWQAKNIEFIYYNILFFIMLVFIVCTQRRLHLGIPVLIGFSVLFIMHLSGGLVVIGNTRLYDMVFKFLPFDKIHHFVLGLVFSFLTVSLFVDVKKWRHKKRALFFFFVVLAALGFGAVVEIMEFVGVMFLGSPGVGDYANNAADLVADLFGAAAGAVIMMLMNNDKNL
ncbi:DUF2238 domain-containing protein [Candidatus Woesearchaeota archaeon]|nr:DUF2238 domain-containing protein [Candidatus Woesearchaeota archaeon]MBW3016088.1 DUF2238 domain-containing protein [Candidatus Woesearchaeota archaeon]